MTEALTLDTACSPTSAIDCYPHAPDRQCTRSRDETAVAAAPQDDVEAAVHAIADRARTAARGWPAPTGPGRTAALRAIAAALLERRSQHPRRQRHATSTPGWGERPVRRPARPARLDLRRLDGARRPRSRSRAARPGRRGRARPPSPTDCAHPGARALRRRRRHLRGPAQRDHRHRRARAQERQRGGAARRTAAENTNRRARRRDPGGARVARPARGGRADHRRVRPRGRHALMQARGFVDVLIPRGGAADQHRGRPNPRCP